MAFQAWAPLEFNCLLSCSQQDDQGHHPSPAADEETSCEAERSPRSHSWQGAGAQPQLPLTTAQASQRSATHPVSREYRSCDTWVGWAAKLHIYVSICSRGTQLPFLNFPEGTSTEKRQEDVPLSRDDCTSVKTVPLASSTQ